MDVKLYKRWCVRTGIGVGLKNPCSNEIEGSNPFTSIQRLGQPDQVFYYEIVIDSEGIK